MSDMEQRLAFEEALADDPYDHKTRLVYSDFLDDLGEHDYASWHRAWTPEWQRAKEWLTDFAAKCREWDDGEEDTVPLEAVVEAGRAARADGEHYSCVSGMGFAAESLMADPETREAFWDNWSAYTRTEVDEKTREHVVFMCSC